MDNCYDALLVVLDSLDLPVGVGGGGNRYALIFDDVDVSPTEIDLSLLEFEILIQGTRNVFISTLEQNDDHPITKIDRIKHPSTGTVTIARGRPKTSMQPQNYPLFISRLEFYRNIKLWDTTISYPEDSYVTLDNNVGGWPQKWQANTDTSPGQQPGVSGNWTAIDVGDFIGILQYSPFTVDKATPIQNGFANPAGVFDPDTIGAIAIPDSNMVINDVRGTGDNKIGTYRNWAVFRTHSPNVSDLTTEQKNYLFDVTGAGTVFGFYDGIVVLVDPTLGTLQPPFNGNDANGIPFENNRAIFRSFAGAPIAAEDTLGEWFVLRETEDFDQCAVYDEGLVYEFQVPFTPANRIFPGDDRRRGGSAVSTDFQWRSIADAFLGNECFHTPVSIQNVTGLVASTFGEASEPLDDPNGDPYNEDSAIEIVFGYEEPVQTQEEHDVWWKIFNRVVIGSAVTNFLVNLTTAVYDTFATPNYTNMGWWFVWPSPYPFNTLNGISEEIGQLYGGIITSLNNHRYFDMFNIQYTTTGKQGWIHSDSADLSEITGVEFLFNFDITISGNRIPFTGDIPFSYWCMDKFGTLWKSPKIIYRHLGETQPIKIEFGDLSPTYRGRTPLGIDNVLENIIVAEIEVNEVLFKDNIIMQGFQCETPYDEFGRYSVNLWEQIIKPVFFDIFFGGSGQVRFIGILDAYGFTKTPIAISAPNALSLERTIIPQFEDYQNLINVEQLQRFANSTNFVDQFQYEQYTVEQGGITDLNLEDSVYLHDEFMIKEEDNPGNPNTRLLTLRELHYSVPHDSALLRKGVFVKVIDT